MKAPVLVIIVTFNGEKWIEPAVESIKQSSLEADILAIDNGSTDRTVGILEKMGVETVRMPENVGFGAGNNVGLRRVVEQGYEFAYLLNQDAKIRKDCLQILADALRSNPEYGIVSPIQNDGSGSEMDFQFKKRCAKYLRRNIKGNTVVQVPFVMAAHWMISRSCLEKTGGFSPAFKLYGEDDNFIDRARFCGFKTGVVPAAIAIHDRAQRPNPKSRRMYLKCTTALRHALNPNVAAPVALTLAPLELLAMGIRHLSLTPIKYIPELLRRYPEIIKLRRNVQNQ